MNELLSQFYSMATSLWRRRTQALIVAWLVCLAGWAVVATMPDTFHASARVYVDIPDAMLPAAARNVFAHLIDLVERNQAAAAPRIAPDACFTRA